MDEHKKWSYKILSTLGVLLHLVFVDLARDFIRWINLKPKDVTGQAIVITGAASGLGKSMALQLAKKGAKIAVIDIDSAGLNSIVDKIRDSGGEASGWKGDISKEDEIHRISAEIIEKYGRIDIIICNAAVLSFASFMDLQINRLKQAFDVNVIGTVNTIRAFLPEMQKQRKGQIVCVSSITAFAGEAFGLAYCPTKAAVRSAMECLQMELKDNGFDDIKCTNIYPYFARTPLVLNAGMRPTSTWFPFMSVDSCASRMVDAILKEKVHAFVPSYITLIPMFKG
ncbi:hypothetical protein WR25_21327 [Diploscapter pachys]|uniref:Uncharacterized protein n=1 Tax=Diploscapter pachys TaxID=2018661 RepID=A0A2A2J442_9BILA|nr:hypothetical protein WR25_21327 [Diploscapter pachys]